MDRGEGGPGALELDEPLRALEPGASDSETSRLWCSAPSGNRSLAVVWDAGDADKEGDRRAAESVLRERSVLLDCGEVGAGVEGKVGARLR